MVAQVSLVGMQILFFLHVTLALSFSAEFSGFILPFSPYIYFHRKKNITLMLSGINHVSNGGSFLFYSN